MALLLLHFILHKELLAAVRPSWHYTSQHNLRAICCLPTLSYQLLMLCHGKKYFTASLQHSGRQGGITIMDEKVSSKHMREKSGPGTRQPWKVLNAK